MRYRSAAELDELWRGARLRDVATDELTVEARYADFDDLWEPLTRGVGPAGAYCAALDALRRTALREELFTRLGRPEGAFSLPARAWAVRGVR